MSRRASSVGTLQMGTQFWKLSLPKQFLRGTRSHGGYALSNARPVYSDESVQASQPSTLTPEMLSISGHNR